MTLTADGGVRFEGSGGHCPGCGAETGRVILRGGERTIHMTCDVCSNRSEEERLEALRRRFGSIEQILSQAGVNVRGYGHCTLDSFDPDPDARALEMAKGFVDAFWRRERPGLYLYARRGSDGLATGNGKSHLAVAIMREVLADPKVPEDRMRFVGAAELTLRIRDAWNRKVSTWELTQPHRLAELLVIDDLGVETSDAWAAEALYVLMESRLGRSTIITSNLTLQQQAERDDGIMERVVSRILEQCDPVELRGPDRRIEMAKARRAAVAKPQ